MTTTVDDVSSQVSSLDQLHKLIRESSNLNKQCDNKSTVISDHDHFFELTTSAVEKDIKWTTCSRGLVYLIVNLIATRPALLDDTTKKLLSDYLKQQDVKVSGLIRESILRLLYTKNPNSQTMTWLKYELLLEQLIKDFVYEPRTMSNEILEHVKNELEPGLALKLSSALKSCVELCRKINNKYMPDEEDQEKWCEIIDWMSWLMSGNDADMDLP